MTTTTHETTKHPDFDRYKLTHVGNVLSLWCINCHGDNDGQIVELQNTVDLSAGGIYRAMLAHEETHHLPHRVFGKPVGCTPHENYVSEECRHAKADGVTNLHNWCHMKCRLCGSLCICDCHGGKKAG